MIRRILLLLVVSVQLHANQAEPLPRAYGYVIGDILQQRISLTADGKQIKPAELPALQRVGPWVQRLSAITLVDDQDLSWLVMRYQIINAPLEPTEVALPSLSLPTIDNGVFEVDSQPFSLSPLTLNRQPDNNNLPFMLPDRVPALADGRAAQKKLNFALIALGVTGFMWFAWWLWLQHRDKTVLPFSKALHQLRRLRRTTQSSVNNNSEAWSAVHEAFNSVANKTVSSQTAMVQLSQRQWLEPFRRDIESFYTASDQRFFKPDAEHEAFDLYDLCKALYRAEKQNTSNTGSVS